MKKKWILPAVAVIILILAAAGGYAYYSSVSRSVPVEPRHIASEEGPAPVPLPAAPVSTSTPSSTPGSVPTPAAPQLTRGAALLLLRPSSFAECRSEGIPEQYKSCTVEIGQLPGGRWGVTVTYDGFYDDSERALRLQAVVFRGDGKWMLEKVTQTHQCWPGRGHQDFSTESCV